MKRSWKLEEKERKKSRLEYNEEEVLAVEYKRGVKFCQKDGRRKMLV